MLDLLAIVGRVAAVYISCAVLLRVTGRRDMSELGPMDILAMLLLSETVSPAMTGGDDSLVAGIVAALTLFALVFLTNRVVFWSRRAESLMQGKTEVLIDNGRVLPDVMRDFKITDEDLRTALHQEGLMEVGDVGRAYVEPDGQITIIEMDRYRKMRQQRAPAHAVSSAHDRSGSRPLKSTQNA